MMTVRKSGIVAGFTIWFLIMICAETFFSDFWTYQWNFWSVDGVIQYRVVSVLFFCVLIVISFGLIDHVQIDNFNLGFGSLLSKCSTPIMKKVTGPFHRECRWWDQHLVEEALYDQMDEILAVYGATAFPKDITRLFVDWLPTDALIRAMADERDHAIGEANSNPLPSSAPRMCPAIPSPKSMRCHPPFGGTRFQRDAGGQHEGGYSATTTVAATLRVGDRVGRRSVGSSGEDIRV